MEHYFSIAGAVVKISGDEDKLFSNAGALENFRVSPQPWDHEVCCDLTDEIYMGQTGITDEKQLLHSCIVAVTQKIYLEKCLEAIAMETADQETAQTCNS